EVGGRALDDVDVPEGDGIEGTGDEGDRHLEACPFNRPLAARPRSPRYRRTASALQSATWNCTTSLRGRAHGSTRARRRVRRAGPARLPTPGTRTGGRRKPGRSRRPAARGTSRRRTARRGHAGSSPSTRGWTA